MTNKLLASEAYKKLLQNDPTLTYANFNNQWDIDQDLLHGVLKSLGRNTHVKEFHFVNTGMTDYMVDLLAMSLMENKTITLVNISSNKISAEGIQRLLLTIREYNSTLTTLNLSDQYQEAGYGGELKIAEFLESCKNISKFGYTFKNPAARHKADRAVSQNSFALRQKRNSLKAQVPVKLTEKVVSQDDGLPEGWFCLGPTKITGKGEGLAYKHKTRGIVQFRHPSKPKPKGWYTYYDDEHRAFFVHRKTGHVSWFIETDPVLPSELKNFEY